MKAYHRPIQTLSTHTDTEDKPSLWKRLAPHLPALFVLLFAVCLCYPWWFQAGGPAYDDLTRLNAPQRMYLAWAYRHGSVPLWNPFNFGGQPFLAAGQSGPLYLPNIVFVVLPIIAAFKVSYAFHALLAATGCYFSAYHLTRHRYASVAAGVVFVACGFLVGHQIHTQMYDAVCWLPVLLYFALRTLDDPSKRFILAIGVLGALEIYAGHPQMTFDEGCFLAIVSLSTAIIRRTRQALRAVLSLAMSGVLAVLLSAPQWLPTLQFVTYSDRQKPSAAFLLHLSMPAGGWLQFLTPFTAGGGYSDISFNVSTYSSLYGAQVFWELTCYAGITALVLAITAMFTAFRTHAAVASLVVAGIVSTLFTMGSEGPMKDILVDVPGFDLFRIPARFVLLDDLCVAVLCAVGIAALCKSVRARTMSTMIVFSSVSIVAVAALTILGASGFSPAGWSAVQVPLILTLLLTIGTWSIFLVGPSFVRNETTFRGMATSWLLVLLVLVDVTLQASLQTPFVMEPKPAYTEPDNTASFVQQHLNSSTPLQKVVSFPDAPLAFDESSSFQIPSLDGYDSLEPSWYAWNIDLTWDPSRLLSSARSMVDAYGVKYVLTGPANGTPFVFQSIGPTRWSGTLPTPPSAPRALEIVAQTLGPNSRQTGALLSLTLTTGTRTWTTLVSGNDGNTHFVVPLPTDWPRTGRSTLSLRCETWTDSVYVESVGWLTKSDSSKRSSVHKTLYPEPLTEVYSDKTGTVWLNPSATSGVMVSSSLDNPLSEPDGNVSVTSMKPNREVWQINADKDGWLVLGQTYDPNWTAYVDGVPVSVVQAGAIYGNVLTGIPVDKGTHHVVLVYHPEPFYAGLYVAGGTILLLVLLVMRALIMARYRNRSPRSPK